MRRYTLLAVLGLFVGLQAPVLRAAPPTHLQFTFTGSFDVPAGGLCDFAYHQEFTVDERITLFANGRVIAHDTQFVTHVNADTGFALSEVDHIQFMFDPSTERFRQVGLVWHLRDAEGKLVVVQAGQLLIDTNTGEIVKATPNFNPDFAGIICPALGGEPA